MNYKLVFLFVSTIISAPSYAYSCSTPSGQWEEISHHIIKAEGPNEFEQLKNEYPKAFSEYEVQEIKSAKLSVTIYRFEGVHTCPENDPRLFKEKHSPSVCKFTDQEDIFECSGVGSWSSPPSDPCR